MSASGRRLRFGLESVGMVVLALAACVLVVDLSARSYLRFDLSLDGRNTLAPEIADRIEKLPGPVAIDVFFRPLREPFDRPAAEARGRFLELLYKARNARRDRVDVTVHDLADLAGTRARQQELGVEGTQLVVFSSGGRRAAFGLFDELADVDWGNPTADGMAYLVDEGLADALDPRTWNPDPRALRPPFLARFRGEEVLATGLAKVSQGDPPVVRFTTGHGEPPLDATDGGGLARLARALETDGFVVDVWDPQESPAVPDGTDVLAVVGPEQPLAESTRETIHAWVDEGGRLFLAPSLAEALEDLEGGAAALAFRYGMVLERGVVCQALPDRFGRVHEGRPECAGIVVGEAGLSASHAVTEPLRMRGARVHVSLAPTFRLGQHPGGSQPLTIVSSPAESWLDLPDADGRPNFRRDPGESRARRPLAAVASFGATSGAAPGEVRRSTVLALTSSLGVVDESFQANRDVLLNVFNHLAEREFRIGVQPDEERVRRLDLRGGDTIGLLSLVLNLALPGLFVVIGGVLAWRRRGG